MSRSLPWMLAALVLLVMAALLAVDASTLSSTVDEPFHVTRGLAWWWADTRLSYAHPPLANAWMALPTVLTEPALDPSAHQAWQQADSSTLAEVWVAEDLGRYQRWLTRGRLACALLSLGFVAYVGAWVGRRWGAPSGLLAMAMVGFDPSLLAHGRLVTTDLAVIAVVFVTTTLFLDYLDGRRGALFGFGLAVGASLGVKFTAATIVPWYLLVGGFWAWRGWGRFAQHPPRARASRLAGDVGVVALLGWLVLLASYRFQGVFWTVDAILAHPEPMVPITRGFDGAFLEATPLGALPGWLPIPLPYTWLYGLCMVGQQAGGGWNSWLLGSVTQGTPLYFPVLLLVKTPLPIVAGLFLHAGYGRRDAQSTVLLGTAAWLGLFLLGSKLNVGVRHALPVVPLITVVVARDLVHLRWRWVAPAVVGWMLARCVWAQGDYLSWFNVGDAGYEVSVVGEDWGQDLDEAAAYLRDQGVSLVVYDPYGAAALPILQARGLFVRSPRPCGVREPMTGTYMAHRHHIVRYPDCKAVYRRPPDHVVNDHIFLWDLSANR